jgi:hypothetical protein
MLYLLSKVSMVICFSLIAKNQAMQEYNCCTLLMKNGTFYLPIDDSLTQEVSATLHDVSLGFSELLL